MRTARPLQSPANGNLLAALISKYRRFSESYRGEETMRKRTNSLSILIFVIAVAALSWGCAAPMVKLKVSRDEINKGDPVTVRWESKKAKAVELNGQKVEKIGAQTLTPEQTLTFEVVARRGKKQARDSATVNVITIVASAPTITLRADPDAIETGQNTTLRWSAENARTVTITGLGEVPASGEREVSPPESTTYTAEARGDGGAATAGARVTVAALSSPPADPPPATGPSIEAEFAGAVTPVFFDYDKAAIKPSEQEKLRRTADWLLQERNRSITFRVEGNCDPRGTTEYNFGLGDRRARAVKEFLVSLGVEEHRIETLSHGLENAK
jgi:peptidoglycan-associated lipoprotein